MVVLKFGGTSVGSTDKIVDIANYLKLRVGREKLCVVVSAMGKNTDLLVDMANLVSDNPSGRELDQLLATGEQQTISLLAMALDNLGVCSLSLRGDQAAIKTSDNFNNAKIVGIDKVSLLSRFEEYDVLIVAGFQGVDFSNNITTLGRGGSDTTAVALACVLGCNCEIYTDVCGIYTTDPRVYSRARKLDVISYQEMIELSSLGAGVMHSRSVVLASRYGVEIYVAKSLSNRRGTMIRSDVNENNEITGVTSQSSVVSVRIELSGVDFNLSSLFKLLGERGVNIDMVSQVALKDSLIIGFTCLEGDVNVVKEVCEQLRIVALVDTGFAKVSVVGSGMKDAVGVVGRLYSVLDGAGVSYYQTSTSEITVSFLVKECLVSNCVEIICEEFNLGER